MSTTGWTGIALLAILLMPCGAVIGCVIGSLAPPARENGRDDDWWIARGAAAGVLTAALARGVVVPEWVVGVALGALGWLLFVGLRRRSRSSSGRARVEALTALRTLAGRGLKWTRVRLGQVLDAGRSAGRWLVRVAWRARRALAAVALAGALTVAGALIPVLGCHVLCAAFGAGLGAGLGAVAARAADRGGISRRARSGALAGAIAGLLLASWLWRAHVAAPAAWVAALVVLVAILVVITLAIVARTALRAGRGGRRALAPDSRIETEPPPSLPATSRVPGELGVVVHALCAALAGGLAVGEATLPGSVHGVHAVAIPGGLAAALGIAHEALVAWVRSSEAGTREPLPQGVRRALRALRLGAAAAAGVALAIAAGPSAGCPRVGVLVFAGASAVAFLGGLARGRRESLPAWIGHLAERWGRLAAGRPHLSGGEWRIAIAATWAASLTAALIVVGLFQAAR